MWIKGPDKTHSKHAHFTVFKLGSFQTDLPLGPHFHVITINIFWNWYSEEHRGKYCQKSLIQRDLVSRLRNTHSPPPALPRWPLLNAGFRAGMPIGIDGWLWDQARWLPAVLTFPRVPLSLGQTHMLRAPHAVTSFISYTVCSSTPISHPFYNWWTQSSETPRHSLRVMQLEGSTAQLWTLAVRDYN